MYSECQRACRQTHHTDSLTCCPEHSPLGGALVISCSQHLVGPSAQRVWRVPLLPVRLHKVMCVWMNPVWTEVIRLLHEWLTTSVNPALYRLSTRPCQLWSLWINEYLCTTECIQWTNMNTSWAKLLLLLDRYTLVKPIQIMSLTYGS